MASARGTRQQPGTVVEQIEPSHAWTEDSNGHYLLVDLPDFKKEQVKIQVINSGTIKVIGERRVNETKRVRFEQTYKVPPENTDTNAITAKFDGETQILYVTVPKQKAQVLNKELIGPESGDPIKDQQNPNHVTTQEERPNSEAKEKELGDQQNPNHVTTQEERPSSEAKEKEFGDRAGTSFSEENSCRRLDREPSYRYIRSAIEILAKNKSIVVTAMLAFSLGMMISRRFESNDE